MSDDWEDILSADELLGRPDVTEYVSFSDTESQELWQEAWDLAPIDDMTDGQIDAFIDMLMDTDYQDWDELLDELLADFWEWFDEEYGGA